MGPAGAQQPPTPQPSLNRAHLGAQEEAINTRGANSGCWGIMHFAELLHTQSRGRSRSIPALLPRHRELLHRKHFCRAFAALAQP